MDIAREICARLDALAIAYRRISHPPAHTMADLQEAQRQLGALIPKNLFLTPRNQSAFYLCLVTPQYAFRTAHISKQIGSSRLSFAAGGPMASLLQTRPGAVSPLGLIFPQAKSVRLLIDQRLRREPVLGFHPNDNTQTLALSGPDFFEKFLPATGHDITWVAPESQ